MRTSNVLGQGRTALITGASRGIGPLIARQIASYGGHVVLTGRSAADLKAVTSDLAANGADVSFIPCDLTEPGAAEALVKEVERQHGGIDLLVNNAGGDPLRDFHAMTIDENLRTLQLNLVAPLALSHAALDEMLLRGRGHIVNISAMAGGSRSLTPRSTPPRRTALSASRACSAPTITRVGLAPLSSSSARSAGRARDNECSTSPA